MNYNIQNVARKNVSNNYFVGIERFQLYFIHPIKSGRKITQKEVYDPAICSCVYNQGM
jgi:hypothetical protein